MSSPKPKPTKAVKPDPALALEVDELGALELEVAPFAPKLARIEILRKAIRERFAGSPGLPQRADGIRYFALLGIQSAPSKVSFTRAGSRTLKVFGRVAA